MPSDRPVTQPARPDGATAQATRREALLAILVGWLSVSCAAPRRAPSAGTDGPGDDVGPDAEALARELLQEFSRAETRAYSEEGIPVFLFGENLARDAAAPPRKRPSANPTQAQLAATFQRWAEVLPRVRPEVTENDVATLIEILADRDFGRSSDEGRR